MQTAVAVAAEHGIHSTESRVVSETHGVLVHLAPAPVLARVGIEPVMGPRAEWQRGAIAFCRYLADAGAPVVPPSDLLEPGPYERDGVVLSFWGYVEDRRDLPFDPRAAGEGLRRIHELGGDYEGELAPFWPPSEAVALQPLLARQEVLDAQELELVAAALDRVLFRLPGDRPEQPLHGDAHIWNCLRTPEGPLWIDFDEACRGPLEWDAATMIESALVMRPNVEVDEAYESAFGKRFSAESLEAFLELRVLLIVEWLTLNAPRERNPRGELDVLLGWLAERGEG